MCKRVEAIILLALVAVLAFGVLSQPDEDAAAFDIEEVAPVVDIIAEEPDESELIEAALLEQGYFREEIPLDFSLQDELRTVCNEYSVPLHIALGVIQAESSFTEDARSGSCYGYMQINSVNASWLNESIGVTDLTDPYQNIRSGVYMLGDLYEKYGDWHKALIAYNYGEAGAQKHVFSQGYTTTTYSRTVMAYADEWEDLLKGETAC